jgi:hypothetical protein
MMNPRILLVAAIAALLAAPHGALAAEPLLESDQVLEDVVLELGDIEFQNVVTQTVDVSTEPSETVDLDFVSGESNLQDNAGNVTLATSTGDSALSQSLLGNSFNRDSADLPNTRMRNSVSVHISAAEGVAGTVGFNAAAGALNIQKNAAAIAAVPASVLAQSFADVRQIAQSNFAAHADVINNISADVRLQNVTGNVGINLGSGVGNVQLNTVTTSLSLPPP